jgi:hypothetical protein
MGSGGGSEEDSVSGRGAPPRTLVFSTASQCSHQQGTSQPLSQPPPPPPQRSLKPKALLLVRSLLAGSGAGVVIDGSWVLSRHAAVQLYATNYRFWRPPALPAVHAMPAPVVSAALPTVQYEVQVI